MCSNCGFTIPSQLEKARAINLYMLQLPDLTQMTIKAGTVQQINYLKSNEECQKCGC